MDIINPDNIAAHQSLIDEQKVAAHLENLAALVSAEELAALQSCARRTAELQLQVFTLGLEIAARHRSDDDADEANVREAIGRYVVLQTFNCLQELGPQELTVN